ncbi:MAG: hypothetical protein ACFCUU_13500, partial [Cyclobacteriaceae bacterium]
MKNNKIDEFVRAKLTDFEKSPSNMAWEKLAAGLERKRKIVLWKRIGIAASLTLLVSFSFYLIVNQNQQAQPTDHLVEKGESMLPEQKTTDPETTPMNSPKQYEPLVEPDKKLVPESPALADSKSSKELNKGQQGTQVTLGKAPKKFEAQIESELPIENVVNEDDEVLIAQEHDHTLDKTKDAELPRVKIIYKPGPAKVRENGEPQLAENNKGKE